MGNYVFNQNIVCGGQMTMNSVSHLLILEIIYSIPEMFNLIFFIQLNV